MMRSNQRSVANIASVSNKVIEIEDDFSPDLFSPDIDGTQNELTSPTLPDCFIIANEPKDQSTIDDQSFKSNNSKIEKHKALVDYLNSKKTTLTPIPTAKTHKEKLLMLQKERDVGLYVQCDKCNKHRFLKDVKDPLSLSKYWFCYMNPDTKFNDCSYKEEKMSAYIEEVLIEGQFNAGSIVWAKMTGYPWWPGMIDDDPDVEQYFWVEAYSDKPSFYNIVFFDYVEVSRAWLKPNKIKRFKESADQFKLHKQHKFYKRIEFGRNLAKEALNYDIYERLQKYSFVSRWPKAINKPIDVLIIDNDDDE